MGVRDGAIGGCKGKGVGACRGRAVEVEVRL